MITNKTIAFFLSAIGDPPLGPELVAVGQSAIGGPQSEITAGSPAWQLVFLSFAACLTLFEIIRGWRLGVMRQLMRAVAVLAAYAAAYFGGSLLVPYLRSWLQVPDLVISGLGGAILAVAVYGILSSLGTLFFKRTAQQSTNTARMVYGLGGALLGVCFGVFFLWMILIGIRMIGSIAEAQLLAKTKSDPVHASNSQSADATKPSIANVNVDSAMPILARLKNSVELGTVGTVVKKADVMPTGVYQTLGEAGTVLSDPDSAQRFLNFPGARELSENPKIVALRNDPEIAEMVAQGRVLDLLRDPRVVNVLNDPALVEQVKTFDLKKALEFAKQKPRE